MKITVEQYLRQWLEGKIEREEIDANTQVSYRHHIEAHLIPQLGRIRLRDLRGRHLTAAYARIVEQRQAEIADAKAKRAARIAEIEKENAQRRAQGKKRMPGPQLDLQLQIPDETLTLRPSEDHRCN